MLRARPIASALREAAPDAVIVQYPSKGYGWTLGAPLLATHIVAKLSEKLGRRIPFIAAIHEYKDAHPLRRQAIAALVRQAHNVITPCVLEAGALRSDLGVAPVVIPDGDVFSREIEPAEMEKLYSKLGGANSGKTRAMAILGIGKENKSNEIERSSDLTSGLEEALEPGGERFRFFTYGHLASSKDPLILAEALKLAAKELPEIRLVIASNLEGGGIRKKFKRRVMQFGLERQIISVGPLPAVALKAVAENCAAQIYTFKDGFTGKRSSAISALSFECPIVATRAEEVSTPFEEVPKGDAKALAVALLKIASRERSEYARWRSNQVRSQQAFLKEFDFAVIAERYIEEACGLL